MPFHGYTPIPDSLGKPITDSARFLDWHVAEGDYIQPDTEIAMLQIGETRYSLLICFPAIIDKQLAEAGSTIHPGTTILRWSADGENIPYGKAYFKTQPMAMRRS